MIKLPDPRTRDGIKTIARFVVARATSITVVAIINQNIDPDELPAYKEASVFIGAHVLGEIVAGHTEKYVNEQIDGLADAVSALKEAKAEIQKELKK